MLNELDKISLEGDEKSFTKRVIRARKNQKVISRTIELPEPDFFDISHLISNKPMRFAQRRNLG